MRTRSKPLVSAQNNCSSLNQHQTDHLSIFLSVCLCGFSVLGIGFFVPLPFLCDHMFFMFVWLLARMIETADVHSGYDIPFNPLRLIPFYGGTILLIGDH